MTINLFFVYYLSLLVLMVIGYWFNCISIQNLAFGLTWCLSLITTIVCIVLVFSIYRNCNFKIKKESKLNLSLTLIIYILISSFVFIYGWFVTGIYFLFIHLFLIILVKEIRTGVKK